MASQEQDMSQQIIDGVKQRYDLLSTVVPDPDFGLSFHLEGLHRFATEIYHDIARLAVVSPRDRSQLNDAAFDIQFHAGYFRERHLRVFALGLTEHLFIAGRVSRPARTPPPPTEPSLLERPIAERLRALGARSAGRRSVALVALATSCLCVRREVLAVVACTAPPVEEFWRLLVATEQLGWWVGEVYPWLNRLALRRYWEEDQAEKRAEAEAERRATEGEQPNA